MRAAKDISDWHLWPGSYGRLAQDIGDLGLRRGEVGVVRAVMPGPADAYDVEFHRPGGNTPLRVLLLAQQVEPETGNLLSDADAARFQPA